MLCVWIVLETGYDCYHKKQKVRAKWKEHTPTSHLNNISFWVRQHCKVYMTTFQHYWWRKTSGAPLCIISGKSEPKSLVGGDNQVILSQRH